MHQPGCEIAAIAGIRRYQRILPLVEFIQAPLRSGGMQMRHSLLRQSDHALRHNHRQPFYYTAFLLGQTARLQPENAAGKRAIDRRLGFLVVGADDGQSALTLAQPAAQVGWPERMFEVDAGGEASHGPSGKIPLERPPQTRFVGDPRRPSRGRRPPIAIAAKIEPRGTVLPHALDLQSERRGLHFRVEHPAHDVPLVRPEMQQAFAVFAGNRIFRLGQIERDGGVFNHDRSARAIEELGEHVTE